MYKSIKQYIPATTILQTRKTSETGKNKTIIPGSTGKSIKINKMKYYINKTINTNLEAATTIVTEKLQKEGFGIVTRFDVNKALKEKLDIDFRQYRILGACNPAFALRSINTENKIGTILPCNVMLQEVKNGTEVAIINPTVMVADIDNDEMKMIAGEINEKLQRVITSI